MTRWLRVSAFGLLCGAAGIASGCSGDGGTPPELSPLGKILDRNVFAYGQDHTSTDPQQQLRGAPKKTLVYFENMAGGMRYLKVVMDLSTLGFDAYAGTLKLGADDTVTFEDSHLCHYSEQTSTELHGDTLETILSQMSGCLVPTTGPESYSLKSETVRERLTLYDEAKGVTLTQLYRAVPGSVASSTQALLGAYQLTGSFYCSPVTPGAYLMLHAAPSAQLRYTVIAEQDPYAGFAVEEGTFAVSGTSLTFTPEYQGTCASTSYLSPTTAPVFPLNLRTATCTPAPQLPTSYSFDHETADATCTLFLKELRLKSAQGVLPYMRGALGFPATTGKGAHYLWGVVPQT